MNHVFAAGGIQQIDRCFSDWRKFFCGKTVIHGFEFSNQKITMDVTITINPLQVYQIQIQFMKAGAGVIDSLRQ